MANTNVTETLATPVFPRYTPMAEKASKHEKKSCSMIDFDHSKLMSFLGKRIQVIHTFEAPMEPLKVIARVMAVQIPAQGTDIEAGFLLLEDGSSDDGLEYVAVGQLEFVSLA